jgi:hypothetical protein
MRERLKLAAKCSGDHDIVVGQVVAPVVPAGQPVCASASRTCGKA